MKLKMEDEDTWIDLNDLMQVYRERDTEYLILGHQNVSLEDHHKPLSLDYWLRQQAHRSDTGQVTEHFLEKLTRTGLFELRDDCPCPQTGRLCRGLVLIKPKVRIRDILPSDCRAIHLLNKQLGYDFPFERTCHKLDYLLTEHRDMLFGAVIGGTFCGYVHGSPYRSTYGEDLVNIMGLVVDESYRKQGIARKLMDRVKDEALRLRYSGIRLVSGYDRKEAHQFYLNYGFLHRKDQKNFVLWFDRGSAE